MPNITTTKSNKLDITVTEASKLMEGVTTLDEFYARWNHIKPNLEQAEGYMIEYGYRLAENSGTKFEPAKLKAYGAKMNKDQVVKIHGLFQAKLTVEQLSLKYPDLPQLTITSASTYEEAEGDNPVEKTYALQEYTEAFIQEVIEGRTEVSAIGKTKLSKKDKIMLKGLLVKAINVSVEPTESLQATLEEIALDTGFEISPTRSWVKTYKENKRRVEKALRKKAQQAKQAEADKLKNKSASAQRSVFEIPGELCAGWQVEYEELCTDRGFKRPKGGSVSFAKLGGMDNDILTQLLDVVDAWKSSRASILKSAHPDTGGNPEAIQVMNVVNSIMKEVINYNDWLHVKADRAKIKKEFMLTKLVEAELAVKNGEVENIGEWYENQTKGGC